MHKVHQKLHLQHHRHTGKLLHHRHTSYRGLAVVIGLAGLMILGLNTMARVTADSLFVYARNPAPIPTTAATITSPIDGSKTSKASITVSGTCPVITPRVIVVILDNGTETASTACDASDDFQVDITLSPGQNVLVARSYTITDDTGPDSAPVTITSTYNPPQPVPPGTPAGTNTGSTRSDAAPLVLAIDEPFVVFGPAKDAVWTGTITGGLAPYHVTVNWGDGSPTKYTLTQVGEQSFRHHYRAMQPYDVTIQVRDGSGQIVTRHYAAVTPYVPPATASLFTTPSTPLWGGNGIFGIYGAYLLLLAGFGWLWVRAHPFAYAKVPTRRRSNHHNHRATRR